MKRLGSSYLQYAVFVILSGLSLSAVGQERPEQFRIGVVLSLSGPLGEYGTAILNGFELAERSIRIERKTTAFVIEDAGNDTQSAVAAFRKLVEVDRVDLIYVWGVQFCKALAPLAEERKVALVAQCVNDDIARDRRYILRFMNHAGEYAAVLAEHLRKHGYRSIDVVVGEQPYIEDMFRVLQAALSDGEQLNKTDRHLTSQLDFRSTITRLRGRKPAALGVFLLPGQIAPFYKQLREQRLTIPTFGTNTFESQSEINRAEGAMEGAVFVNHHVAASFRADYRASFGDDSQITWAALAFEFRQMLEQILPKLRAARGGQEIIAALSSFSGGAGLATGRFEYVNDPTVGAYFRFPLVLKTIREGKIVELADDPPAIH